MTLNRDLAWLLSAILFGLLVLPLLVYGTGITMLGPYAHGGAGAFFGDYLADLGRLRWFAWTIALGPAAVVGIWRAVTRFPRTRSVD